MAFILKPEVKGYKPFRIRKRPSPEKISVAIGCLRPKPTACQMAVLKGLVNWYYASRNPFALLNAPAGCGKSFVAGAFQKVIELLGEDSPPQVILAAPTHRALREALNKNKLFRAHAKGLTVARLLGMRARYTNRGDVYFEQQGDPDLPHSTNLVIVDEMSMVADELAELLQAHATARDSLKFLFLGDDRQLPAVGENKLNRFFGAHPLTDVFRLTEVVRHDGAVLEQATRTRQKLVGRPTYSTVDDGAEVQVLRDPVKFHKLFVESFDEQSLSQPGLTQGLAWTNRRVDDLNRRARRKVFGADAPEFIPGELLINKNPICIGGESGYDAVVLSASSTYIQVVSASPAVYNLDEGSELKVWEIEGWCPDLEQRIYFTRVHQDDRDAFESEMKQLKSSIIGHKCVDSFRKELWRDVYYPLLNYDAPVSSACAITVHRAQGSTVDRVFVDMSDIDRSSRDPDFHNRLAYTAVSRAAKQLIILDFQSR